MTELCRMCEEDATIFMFGRKVAMTMCGDTVRNAGLEELKSTKEQLRIIQRLWTQALLKSSTPSKKLR